MVEACSCDLIKVILGDPSVPMIVKLGESGVLAKGLSIGIFIHHCLGVRPVIEDRRSDPWLEDEPSAEIDSSYFIGIVVEGYRALIEATVWYISNTSKQ